MHAQLLPAPGVKLIPSDVVEEECRIKSAGIPLVGCQKAGIIALFPDGSWKLKRHLVRIKQTVYVYHLKCFVWPLQSTKESYQ